MHLFGLQRGFLRPEEYYLPHGQCLLCVRLLRHPDPVSLPAAGKAMPIFRSSVRIFNCSGGGPGNHAIGGKPENFSVRAASEQA